jgi:hypothetical protein
MHMPRRSAHQHLPCSPSTAVMPASPARTGGESATSHVPRSQDMEDNIHLSVPRAQRRCAASRGALSAQHSNLAAATSKPKAAFCGAVDASLRDGLGSGSQCTLLRTHACARAPSSHARVSALRECAGCASVSPMWTHSECPMLGTMWWIAHQGGIPCGVPVVLHESTRSTLSDRLQYPCEYFEYLL